MIDTTFQAFEAQARALGFTDVLERRWAPLTVLGTHDHPFDANCAKFAASGIPFYVCPGTSTWNCWGRCWWCPLMSPCSPVA